MEYNQFRQLLQLRGIMDKETVPLLEGLISKFPYCQTSRLLLAKALHDQDSIHYHESLRLAAAYAPNREVLHDLIELKPEEKEFEFPLFRKEESVQQTTETVQVETSDVFRLEEQFEESYTEDEISGRAFEEQREKEKRIEPHDIIRQRLDEILSGVSQEATAEKPEVKSQEKKSADAKMEVPASPIEERKEVISKPEEKYSAAEEIKSAPVSDFRKDAEESVYKEDLLSEQKLEEELIHPVPEKSPEEKAIIQQAEKARDVLDKLELEHAMEESILDSLEKLPVIAAPRIQTLSEGEKNISPGSPPQTTAEIKSEHTPRSFTDWLKTLKPETSGFEEVRAKTLKGAIREEPQVDEPVEEAESSLSDDELIEKFLLEDPKIVASKAEFYSPVAQAKKSVMDHDDVVSETLAKIYLDQGNTQKARWCYEKLMLLHPEKSAFFAALLKEIDTQTNSKEDL